MKQNGKENVVNSTHILQTKLVPLRFRNLWDTRWLSVTSCLVFMAGKLVGFYKLIKNCSRFFPQRVRSKTAAGRAGTPLQQELLHKCCMLREWRGKIVSLCFFFFFFFFWKVGMPLSDMHAGSWIQKTGLPVKLVRLEDCVWFLPAEVQV